MPAWPRHLKKTPGAPVLIVGGAAKSIGLYAAAGAVAMGSSQVDYWDGSPTRLALASALGANSIELRKNTRWFRRGEPARSEGYPIAVDASSTA